MITVTEIRDHLARYLSREMSLNEFEDWLVVRSWNMHQDSDEAAQQLVGKIELRLAEYSDDHLTDEGLERELAGLLSPSVFVYIDESGNLLEPRLSADTFSVSSQVSAAVAVQ